MKFKSFYDGSDVVPESNSGEYLVCTAGFIPDDIRVKELLLAGERVEAYKLGENFQQGDYDDIDDDNEDTIEVIDEYADEMELQDQYNRTQQKISEALKARDLFYSRRLRESERASIAPVRSVDANAGGSVPSDKTPPGVKSR